MAWWPYVIVHGGDRPLRRNDDIILKPSSLILADDCHRNRHAQTLATLSGASSSSASAMACDMATKFEIKDALRHWIAYVPHAAKTPKPCPIAWR